MNKQFLLTLLILLIIQSLTSGQNYDFNFNTSGRRVCLVTSEVNVVNNQVKIIFHDSLSNTSETIDVNRRLLGTNNWTNVANDLPAGTGNWIDNNVSAGDIWEYQVRRENTWFYQSANYDAIGYTIGNLQSDNTDYKGRMILLVSNDIPTSLPSKYTRLKKEITADGWLVEELIVNRANNWDSGSEVVTIKNQINTIYSNAPNDDKHKVLFILGHVPLPRCGSTAVTAPDAHDENKGARGCDAYYADLDGEFTDVATYNPGGLATPLAINLPGDFKWDQDFFPSDIEMAFGRIDFADLTDVSTSEMDLIENYLDRLSQHKNVDSGFDMGNKSAYYFGYDNSNDGSYRSLPNISTTEQLYENYNGANHNEWVQNNGPFKIYMQNQVVPTNSDWQTYGMDATVYASDQSYWGFGDVPQPGGVYSRIRGLLAQESKCLVTLWTTTGINIFHQACTGQALGLAMKEIMNHNPDNQYLEKAPQAFDTEDWWNRTHFTFYGDPTLNLYQISPPSNVSINSSGNNAILEWTNSVDPDVMAYHVYKSATEFGKFERITTSPINSNNFIIPNYQQGTWYMVKAVKMITSGCGQFIHSSLGKETEGDLVLSTNGLGEEPIISIYPNPANNFLQIESSSIISSIELLTIVGQKIYSRYNLAEKQIEVDISDLPENVYLLKLKNEKGYEHVSKIMKNNEK